MLIPLDIASVNDLKREISKVTMRAHRPGKEPHTFDRDFKYGMKESLRNWQTDRLKK